MVMRKAIAYFPIVPALEQQVIFSSLRAFGNIYCMGQGNRCLAEIGLPIVKDTVL